MLTVSQLSKSFAGRALFDDVSLQVNRGDRIGLVGPNGAGKSTLFSLLLGDVSPDKGMIAIEKNAKRHRHGERSLTTGKLDICDLPHARQSAM
jgi:ATPase subunit of ABC transporter with duplicated ATPase domains